MSNRNDLTRSFGQELRRRRAQVRKRLLHELDQQLVALTCPLVAPSCGSGAQSVAADHGRAEAALIALSSLHQIPAQAGIAVGRIPTNDETIQTIEQLAAFAERTKAIDV